MCERQGIGQAWTMHVHGVVEGIVGVGAVGRGLGGTGVGVGVTGALPPRRPLLLRLPLDPPLELLPSDLLGILLVWAVRRWPYEAFQVAQAGARAHKPLRL
jgi:hypothetical protein